MNKRQTDFEVAVVDRLDFLLACSRLQVSLNRLYLVEVFDVLVLVGFDRVAATPCGKSALVLVLVVYVQNDADRARQFLLCLFDELRSDVYSLHDHPPASRVPVSQHVHQFSLYFLALFQVGHDSPLF